MPIHLYPLLKILNSFWGLLDAKNVYIIENILKFLLKSAYFFSHTGTDLVYKNIQKINNIGRMSKTKANMSLLPNVNIFRNIFYSLTNKNYISLTNS